MEPNSSNTPDARSLVSDGRAGTGSAFLLQNAWGKAVDIGLAFGRQDAADARQRTVLGHQRAAAAAKSEADQQAAADKYIAGNSKFDPTGVMPEDTQHFVEMHNASVAQTAADIARNRHPGNSRNAPEWQGFQQRTGTLVAEADQSKQWNQERIKQMQTVQGAGVDNPYDSKRITEEWKAFAALPFEERVRVGPPKLARYLDPMRIAKITMTDVKLAKSGEGKPVSIGGQQGVENTVTQAFKPEDIALGAKSIRAYPGVEELFTDEYKALPVAQRERYGNYEEYALDRSVALARSQEGGGTVRTLSLHNKPVPSVSVRQREQSWNASQESATNLLTKYSQLKGGSPEQFPLPAVVDGKSYLKSDEFNAYNLGTGADGKPNHITGVLRDGEGRLFLTTTDSPAPTELRDQDAFNKFLLPLWTGGNMKGKPEVLQSAAKKFFEPGTNTLNVSGLGNSATPASQREVGKAIAGNQAYTSALHQQLAETAQRIDPNSDATVEFKGKAYPKAAVDAATLTALLKRGHLMVEGSKMLNPSVTVKGAGGKVQLLLNFDKVVDKKGTVQPANMLVTPSRLAELMKGYVPNDKKLDKPATAERATPAPGTAPMAAAQRAATTVTTKTSSGKRDLLNLSAPAAAPTSTKRNRLGL